MYALSESRYPSLGRVSPLGIFNWNSFPEGVFRVSLVGLKPRSLEKTLAMTISGEARKMCVAGLLSRRPEKLRLYEVMMEFSVP